MYAEALSIAFVIPTLNQYSEARIGTGTDWELKLKEQNRDHKGFALEFVVIC